MDNNKAPNGLPADMQQRLDDAVFSSQPLDQVLDLVMDTALSLLRAEYGSLRWVNYREQALELLRLRSASGVAAPATRHPLLPLDFRSVVTTVFRTKTVQYVPDIAAVPDLYVPLDDCTPVGSELAVPIFASDGLGVLGVLNVESPRTHAFSEPQAQEMLCALARRAQLVVRRARLSATLREVSDQLLHRDHQALLAYTVDALAELVSVPVCAIWLLDPATGDLALAQAIGRPHPRPGTQDDRLPRQSWLGKVLDGRQPRPSRRVLDEPDYVARELAEQEGWVSALAVPVRAADGQALGVLCLYSKEERAFTEQDCGLALACANSVAVAWQQAKLLADNERYTTQVGLIRALLAASASLSDLDTLLYKAADEIHQAFGYNVDLALIERTTEPPQLVFKTSVLYNGDVRRDSLVLPLGEGITGTVAETGRAEVVRNVRTDPRYHGDYEETRSELAIALTPPNGRPMGVLNVESCAPTPLSKDDLAVFKPIADGIALAIENAHRLQELTALHKILTATSQAQELRQVLDNLAAPVLELFQAQACTLYLQDTDGQHLTLVSQQGLPEAVAARVRKLAKGQSIAGKVLASGAPMVVRDLVTDPRANGTVQPEDPLRSCMTVPIKTATGVLGVLGVSTRNRRLFTDHDVKLLDVIGTQIGLAIAKTQWAERYHQLYQDARDPMFTVDRERRITDVNQQATEVLGYTRQELLGTELMALVAHEHEATQARARFHGLLGGAAVPLMEFEIRRKDHTTFVIESNLTPIYDHLGALTAVQAIWRDITARREAADAQKAAMLVQQLSALGGILVHKGAGRVGLLISLTEELDKQLEPWDAKTAEIMTRIRRENGRVRHLLEQFDRLARRQVPQETARVSLAEVVRSTRARLALPSDAWQLSVESLDDVPAVQTNAPFLSEVLEGLLDNAIEAMSHGGTVSISSTTVPERKIVELRVSDTGPGIPAEHRASLLHDPFFTTKGASGGLGIGLWFSRWALQALGGDLTLAEEPPPGATFLLRLPIALETHPGSSAPARPQKDAPAPPQVLVVDDDDSWGFKLAAPFTAQGWEMRYAASSTEARRLLEQHQFTAFVVDVVLAEHDLMNRDGLAVVQALRDRWASIPGLIVSSWETPLAEARARFRGRDQLWFVRKLDPQYAALVASLTTRGPAAPALPSPAPSHPRPVTVGAARLPQGEAPSAHGAGEEPGTQSQRGGGTPPDAILIVEDDSDWQDQLQHWCAEAGCTVIQEWDATAALHRLRTLSPPPVLALLDLRLHPTGGTAPHQVYDGLPLLTALSSRGIYTLVVSGHIPENEELLLERPGVLELITKGRVPRDACVAKVRQAVAYATAARHAEGQLPKQQARLGDLPLSSRSLA